MSQSYSSDGVRQERSGWRCEAISKRHREWGFNCPAVDLDFVVAEYNHGKPVALIEYKDKRAGKPNIDHPTYDALTSLADGYSSGSLPFLVVVYCSEKWFFIVYPVNEVAKKLYGHITGVPITEQRFVTSLHKLRNKVLTNRDMDSINKLSLELPE